MWPAILAALVGSMATTAGNAMMQKSPQKPPADRMQSFQQANQQDPLGGNLGQQDPLAQYLRGSQIKGY